jgi:hypothetical protein
MAIQCRTDSAAASQPQKDGRKGRAEFLPMIVDELRRERNEFFGSDVGLSASVLGIQPRNSAGKMGNQRPKRTKDATIASCTRAYPPGGTHRFHWLVARGLILQKKNGRLRN